MEPGPESIALAALLVTIRETLGCVPPPLHAHAPAASSPSGSSSVLPMPSGASPSKPALSPGVTAGAGQEWVASARQVLGPVLGALGPKLRQEVEAALKLAETWQKP